MIYEHNSTYAFGYLVSTTSVLYPDISNDGLCISSLSVPHVAYLDGSLESLLDVQPLAHDGLIKFPLEGKQVHVGLRLWHQLSDLQVHKRQKNTGQVRWKPLVHIGTGHFVLALTVSKGAWNKRVGKICFVLK